MDRDEDYEPDPDDYEPDPDDLLVGELELTEAQYAAIGRIALASHRVEELRMLVARVLGKRNGWSTKDVTAYLKSKEASLAGLTAWAERTAQLIERRHEVVHAEIDVECDWEYEDGSLMPYAFSVLRHGRSGHETLVDAPQWNALAAEFLVEERNGRHFLDEALGLRR